MTASLQDFDGWERVPIAELGGIYGGLSGKSAADFGAGNAKYITFLDVINNTRIDARNAESVRVGRRESQHRVRKGDVLFNGTSETPEELALAAVVTQSRPDLYLNSFCFGLRLYDQDRVQPLFLAHLFRSEVGRKLLTALAQGATRYNLSKKQFSHLMIPLPDPAEQRRIATALGEVDDLIASLERLIDKKELVGEAVRHELLTGSTRLPGRDAKWGSASIADLATVVMGQSPPSSNYNNQRRGLPLVQGMSDISWRKTQPRLWSSQGSKSCERGDIILTVRAPVGAVARAESDCFLGRGVCAVSVREDVSTDFIYQQLRQHEDAWASAGQGTTFEAANGNQIRSFSVRLPAQLEEQQAIAEVLGDVDEEITLLRRRLDKVRDVKRSMRQELFTGRTRLLEEAAA